jgi:hypothetical protein
MHKPEEAMESKQQETQILKDLKFCFFSEIH